MGSPRLLCLDAAEDAIASPQPQPAARGATAGKLVHAIYASGSTGRAQTMAIEHRSAVHLMHWVREFFSPQELRGGLASTSICVDVSLFELFAPLSWGGTVILAPSALALPALPAAREVTLVNAAPLAATKLMRDPAIGPGVRMINLAGKPLRRVLAGHHGPIPVPRDRPLPLTSNQRWLWIAEQLAPPGSPLYNVPMLLSFQGPLDPGKLARSLNDMVRRHEVLRTTLVETEGEPVQHIARTLTLTLPVVDLERLPAAEREGEAERCAEPARPRSPRRWCAGSRAGVRSRSGSARACQHRAVPRKRAPAARCKAGFPAA